MTFLIVVVENWQNFTTKKSKSATHICNALCVAEIICNAPCVAEISMQKTELQIFCNASQRCIADNLQCMMRCRIEGYANWIVTNCNFMRCRYYLQRKYLQR